MATALQEIKGEAKRAEVVQLRLAGHTYDEISQAVGLSVGGVRHHLSTWVESIQPPAERAHELRETWGGRLEVAHQKNWPGVVEGDAKAIEVMLRIQAQYAKLFGLELQPGIQIGVFTAEAMARAFKWDHDAEAVEEPAKEIEGAADA